jgi:hypothetical protein
MALRAVSVSPSCPKGKRVTRHRVSRALAMGRPMETGNMQDKIGTRSGARQGRALKI